MRQTVIIFYAQPSADVPQAVDRFEHCEAVNLNETGIEMFVRPVRDLEVIARPWTIIRHAVAMPERT